MSLLLMCVKQKLTKIWYTFDFGSFFYINFPWFWLNFGWRNPVRNETSPSESEFEHCFQERMVQGAVSSVTISIEELAMSMNGIASINIGALVHNKIAITLHWGGMVHTQRPSKTVHSTAMRTQFDTVEEKHKMQPKREGGWRRPGGEY